MADLHRYICYDLLSRYQNSDEHHLLLNFSISFLVFLLQC